MTWKPFLIRLAIFTLLLYAIVPISVYSIGTKPQITINALYIPVVFAGIITAFILLKREELKTFNYTFNWKQCTLFGILAYALFGAYIMQQNMWWGYQHNIAYLLTGWTLYLSGGALLLIAVFNTQFVKKFIKTISFSFAIIIAYTGGAILLNLAGYPLGKFLTKLLAPLLGITNEISVEYEPGPAPILSVDKFTASIGPPCTGITSFILFTGLFLFIIFLDWKKINKKALLWIYPLGALGMLFVAFLRLYLLFWIGANWSPKFALAAFHTNAGWLLFVVYFFIYFWITYPKMIKKQHRKL